MERIFGDRGIAGKLLNSAGITFRYTGFWCLIDTVELILKDEPEEFMVTKDLYPVIANMNHVSSCSVEHAIRNAIKCGWETKDATGCLSEIWEDFDSRPTNMQFINSLMEHTKNISNDHNLH